MVRLSQPYRLKETCQLLHQAMVVVVANVDSGGA
jgi:hypothetical protein